MAAKKKKKKTDDELIAMLRRNGMTDEEIAELGNSPDAVASIRRQHEAKVITIDLTIPPGADREITPEEFKSILTAAGESISEKMLTSTMLGIAGAGIKTALTIYLRKQSAGLLDLESLSGDE